MAGFAFMLAERRTRVALYRMRRLEDFGCRLIGPIRSVYIGIVALQAGGCATGAVQRFRGIRGGCLCSQTRLGIRGNCRHCGAENHSAQQGENGDSSYAIS
jgi:hypothetical protein